MDAPHAADPRGLWPELSDWHAVKIEPEVSRVRLPSGGLAYVRPDDGSSDVLERLSSEGSLPTPHLLDRRQGWLLLSALPGTPLHDRCWARSSVGAARVAADALRRLEFAGVCHGDLCLPNILGDSETNELTGIVDWGLSGQFNREIDVAATVWSLGFNGFSDDIAVALLERCGWLPAHPDEVSRLAAAWVAHAGPVDQDLRRKNSARRP